jgi:tryptophanase
VALYEHIGIRSVEVGTVMLGHVDPQTGVETPAPKELVRLAMPRRVYTQSHVDYMIEMAGHLHKYLPDLRGFRIIKQPRFLRHFTCHFERL